MQETPPPEKKSADPDTVLNYVMEMKQNTPELKFAEGQIEPLRIPEPPTIRSREETFLEGAGRIARDFGYGVMDGLTLGVAGDPVKGYVGETGVYEGPEHTEKPLLGVLPTTAYDIGEMAGAMGPITKIAGLLRMAGKKVTPKILQWALQNSMGAKAVATAATEFGTGAAYEGARELATEGDIDPERMAASGVFFTGLGMTGRTAGWGVKRFVEKLTFAGKPIYVMRTPPEGTIDKQFEYFQDARAFSQENGVNLYVPESVGPLVEHLKKGKYISEKPTKDGRYRVKKQVEVLEEKFAPPKVEPVETGFESADAARDLAHYKKSLAWGQKELEKELAKPEPNPEGIAKFRESIARDEIRVADAQKRFDQIREKMAAPELKPALQERGGGMGTTGKGPQPIKQAKQILVDHGVDIMAPDGIARGLKLWFMRKFGTWRESLGAGFEEVGLPKGHGELAFDIMRQASVDEAIAKRVQRQISITRLGDLLGKEIERFGENKPDVPESAKLFARKMFGFDLRRALRTGDLKSLLAMSQEIDPAMWEAARGIKAIDENGNITFGTRQRAGADFVKKSELADPDMPPPGYDKGLIMGEKLPDGRYQFYREIPEAEARAKFQRLSLPAQEFVKDYVGRMKGVAETQGIDVPMEGYVHAFGSPEKTAFKKLYNVMWGRIKNRIAPQRKYRVGAIGDENIVKSLVQAEEKVMVDFATEEIHNEAAAKILAIAAKPLGRGEAVPEGWREVDFMDKAPEKFRFIVDLAAPLLKKRGIDPGELKKISERYGKNRIMVPEIIADDLGGLLGIEKGTTTVNPFMRAILEMTDEAAGWAINNMQATFLLRPKTTALNFVGGEIQYSTRLLENFFEGIFSGDMLKFRQDVRAYIGSLSPSARERLPIELLGEKWIDQINMQKGQLPGYKEFLFGFRLVEQVQKRRVYDSVIRAEAKKIAGGDKTIEKALIENPTEETLRKAYVEMDRTQFDYANLPKWMQKMKRSNLGRAVMPFPSYMYKGTRLALHLLNPASMNVLSPGLPKGERAMRAARLARTTSLATVGYILTEGMGSPDADKLDYDLTGRVPIGEVDGKRIWVDIKQLPIVRETGFARKIADGEFDYIGDFAEALYGFGPAVDLFDIARDVRDEYTRYRPPSSRLGGAVAQLMPYGPILSYIRKKIDPLKRRTFDTKENYFKNFWMGFASELPELSKGIDPKLRTTKIKDPLTGKEKSVKEPLMYNGLEVDVGFWTPFNIKLVNDSEMGAFYDGRAAAAIKKILDLQVKLDPKPRIKKDGEAETNAEVLERIDAAKKDVGVEEEKLRHYQQKLNEVPQR